MVQDSGLAPQKWTVEYFNGSENIILKEFSDSNETERSKLLKYVKELTSAPFRSLKILWEDKFSLKKSVSIGVPFSLISDDQILDLVTNFASAKSF